jgi:hypothetical protein
MVDISKKLTKADSESDVGTAKSKLETKEANYKLAGKVGIAWRVETSLHTSAPKPSSYFGSRRSLRPNAEHEPFILRPRNRDLDSFRCIQKMVHRYERVKIE